ncbi:hypothetical protein THAOC_09965 [Thalassiosira oceanica]|uniref:EF-hand domain-containing protein n=1 Tax=Thalassiosira oceanica TaxID=159749 RepID=K0T689_THAOC|nr:hypothetical protein THAOC_09965 [Thalassiosira oceanica]|eukprot:EJK68821.1 hypothetical protein THAOC_09965 [Thalassiosira oceanica]
MRRKLAAVTIASRVVAAASSASVSPDIETLSRELHLRLNINLNSDEQHQRRGQSFAGTSPLTKTEFDDCLSDMRLSDIDRSGGMDKSEFLRFLSLNSSRYGHSFGFAARQTSLEQLPLELVLLYHGTACMCAYTSGAGFGCCAGDNERVDVYRDPTLSVQEEAYTELFCTEVYHQYGRAVPPTPPPTVMTNSPTPFMGDPTSSPAGKPTPPPATDAPVSSSPVSDSPTPRPVTGAPVRTTPIPTEFDPMRPPRPPPTTATARPTARPTAAPSSSPIESVLSVGVRYGISSECGVTAADVISGSGGNTIAAGLIEATETVVVRVLNATYPKVGGMKRSSVMEELPHLMRVDGLPGGSRGLVMVPDFGRKGIKNSLDKTAGQSFGGSKSFGNSLGDGYSNGLRRQRRRRLVHYVDGNTAIMDVEDVVDSNCSPGLTCLRVSSIIRLFTEDGDRPDEIDSVIRAGIQSSFQDGSFFQVPDSTLPPTDPPVRITASPVSTAAPTDPPVTTSAPTLPPVSTASPTLPPVSTPSPTLKPVSTASPTLPPVSTPSPTLKPVAVTESPTTARPVLSTGTPVVTEPPTDGGLVTVEIRYDLANDCGLTAEMIMEEDGNTLKDGLEAATTTVTIKILEDFNNSEQVRRQLLEVRHRLGSGAKSTTRLSLSEGRNLAYYSEEHPVNIDRILDIENDCSPGNNCLLVISTITALLDPNDDKETVKDAILSGVQDSFKNGSFYAAVPADTKLNIYPPLFVNAVM